MLKIRKYDIQLTRGDSAYITLGITDNSGAPIEITGNDVIRCQVREAPNGGTVIFSGVIERDDEIVWHIRPVDTAAVAAKDYYWDAEIEFSNGDIFSFVPVSKFTVLPEVTEVS